MVFDTPEFFIFFAVVLALYYVLNHRWQNILLVASSYFFYGWFDWRFCGLLAFSTLLDWYCGLHIQKPGGRKWLYLSVIGQLSLLGFFKYYNFFEENFERLFAAIGWKADWWTLNVVLPVGISFYTFQTLSYTIDLGRGKLKPVRNLLDFAVFVSFWPHLVAGPILRATYMLPQILRRRKVTTRLLAHGTYFIMVGLVKKVAVADVVASAIEGPATHPEQFNSWTLLLSAYLFAFRLYCDFSGYTDIARGVSLFMGFRLQENFLWPYFSVGITQFWRRWHVSLASWLRDYLYIPLGGNRKGLPRQLLNLMITFTLCGLWHRPTWNFIFWGTANGVFLCTGKLIAPWYERFICFTRRVGLQYIVLFILGLATFHMMVLTHMLIGMVPQLGPTARFYQHLFEFSYAPDPNRLRLTLYAAGVLLFIDVPEFVHDNHTYLFRKPLIWRAVFYAVMITLLILTWTKDYVPFFYFQF